MVEKPTLQEVLSDRATRDAGIEELDESCVQCRAEEEPAKLVQIKAKSTVQRKSHLK
jgi:hypothetical protein